MNRLYCGIGRDFYRRWRFQQGPSAVENEDDNHSPPKECAVSGHCQCDGDLMGEAVTVSKKTGCVFGDFATSSVFKGGKFQISKPTNEISESLNIYLNM